MTDVCGWLLAGCLGILWGIGSAVRHSPTLSNAELHAQAQFFNRVHWKEYCLIVGGVVWLLAERWLAP